MTMNKLIEASEQEINVLAQLLDHAVRHGGLNVVKNTAFWLDKLEQAQDVEPAE